MRGLHLRDDRGFTVVELMVSMAIIIVLLGLILVALNLATQRGRRANTQFLMGAITQGLDSFRNDHGYLPPVLDSNRGVTNFSFNGGGSLRTPNPNGDAAEYMEEMQEWFSMTALPDCLLGYGPDTQDGYGNVDLGDVPFLGMRSPGQDGMWNALINPISGQPAGTLQGRNPPTQGRVYQAYLSLNDDRLIAKMNPSDDRDLRFPGDADYDSLDWPVVFVEHFGRPLRYYRQPHPILTPGHPYRPRQWTSDIVLGTLADVFVLRPFQEPENTQTIRAWADDSQGDQSNGYGTAPMALRTASFAILSEGPDKAINPRLRYDDPNDAGNTLGTAFANQDNIVEVGQ